MLAGRAIRELARLLPELGEAPTGVDPGEARARMFGRMLVLLSHLAGRAPDGLRAAWDDAAAARAAIRQPHPEAEALAAAAAAAMAEGDRDAAATRLRPGSCSAPGTGTW